MFARVARVAAFAAAKKAPTALAARCAASPFASTAVRALQTREKSTLGSLLKREIDEEKENLFEGEELAELRAKVEEVFAIKESDSSTEVVLEGEAHGDSIRVKFDVQDVVELEDEEYMDDEDEEEEETEEEEEEEEPEDELPGIRFVAEVTRDNQGLQFEGVASSNLTVERVRFLHDVTADSDKDDLYLGPNFIDLELDVQEHFYSYLAARKVNDDLAQFITQFADLKEQREYLSFLEDTAKFVKH